MPRNLSGSYFDRIASMTHWNSHILEIDPPTGLTLVLSDTPRYGAPIIKSWGVIPPTLVESDTVPDAQSFEVELFNTYTNLSLTGGQSRITTALAADAFEGAECRFYGVDLGSKSAPVFHRGLLFRGKLQQVFAVTQLGCTIRIAGQVSFESRTLDHLVRDDWPQAPTEYAARIQPIVFGRVPDFPVIPIDVGVVGEVGAVLSAGGLTLTMLDDVSRFPATGTVQIGAVEIASYTGRDTALNTLTGLTRGLYGTIDATHAVGTVVMQQLASYRFLVMDPSFGQAGGIDAVRVDGKRLSASAWTFDAATCILTVTASAGKRAGRPTLNRSMAIQQGRHGARDGSPSSQTASAFVPLAAGRSARSSQAAMQLDVPIYDAGNLMLCAWAAASNTHFWNCGTNLTTSPGTGLLRSLPTVALDANTPKSWTSSMFSGYLPPSALLVRESVVVSVTVSASVAAQDVTILEPDEDENDGPIRHMYPTEIQVRSLACRIGDVERVIHLSGDDNVGASTSAANVGIAANTSDVSGERLRGLEHAQTHFVFDFGTDVDPEVSPHDIELEAICDAGSAGRVLYVHALSQGVSGSTPLVIPTGVATAARSGYLPLSGVSLTFPRTFTNALLTITYHCSSDYVKIDLGGGRIVRITPPQHRLALLSQSVLESPGTTGTGAGFSSISVLVQNPSSNMSISARDFGRDSSSPLNNDSTRSTGRVKVLSATLVGVTAGSAAYPLLPDVRADSSFLVAFGEYPRADVRGYVGDGLGMGTGLLENPADVIEHYLRRVMGIAPADTDTTGPTSTFQVVKALYASTYKFAGAIVDQIDRRIPLVDMSRQARAWVQYDAMIGMWIIIYRKSPAVIIAGSVDFAWDPGDWFSRLPRLDRTADDRIVARVNVRYLRDWSKGRDLNAYQAIESSGSGSPTADEKYVCDFIRSSQVAAELAALYAAWDGVATRTTMLDLMPAYLNAQKGDVVSLTMPIGGSDPLAYVGGVNGTKFIVTGQGYAAGSLRDGRPSAVHVLLQEVPV